MITRGRVTKRHLESYESIAQKPYDCSECGRTIEPGEYYRRTTTLVKQGRCPGSPKEITTIVVTRYHEPYCDEDPFLDDEFHKEGEKEERNLEGIVESAA